MTQTAAPTNASASELRVFIVDDHPVVRYAVRGLIEQHQDTRAWRVVGEAADLKDIESRIAEAAPDVVVLDLMLGLDSALPTIETLSRQSPSPRVVVYSLRAASLLAAPCLRAGAAAYVSKSADVGELIRAISTSLRGEQVVAAGPNDRQGDVNAELDRLSPREVEVLLYVGQGMTCREISERIGRSVKTIETYRYRIRQKLELGSAVELTQLATRFADLG